MCGSMPGTIDVPVVGWVSHHTWGLLLCSPHWETPLRCASHCPVLGQGGSHSILTLNFAFSLQKLILSETTIFDVLPIFFYHTNQVVRMAALEVRAGGGTGGCLHPPWGVQMFKVGAGMQQHTSVTPYRVPPRCTCGAGTSPTS